MIITFKKVPTAYDIHYEVKAVIDGVTGISSFHPQIYEQYPDVLGRSVEHAIINASKGLIQLVPIQKYEFFDSIHIGEEQVFCAINRTPELMSSEYGTMVVAVLNSGDSVLIDGKPYTICPPTIEEKK